MIQLPEGAAFVVDRLTRAGYPAYVVGGCVRDALLGIAPKDWDVCTAATPEEMQRVFAGCHVVETGLKHGTLTVVVNHVPYEVTTFRVDGGYTDHRHPDHVTFVADVREDLARRDFTVNAMAYHPDTGLVDAFHGREDLAAGVIRCVGDPGKRFGEDALRILRALRFASVYGFTMEEQTARAVHSLKKTLHGVAAERIRVELGKLLCGRGAEAILRDYADVIMEVLPALRPMVGFDQRTPYHRYDVWEHTIRAVGAVAPVETLRWTMLLHDSGKPACFTLDEKGRGHAFGHGERSVEIAREAMAFLRVDNATRDRVLMLVARHDMALSDSPVLLRRCLHDMGEEALRQLIEVQRADERAKGITPPETADARAQAMNAALDAVLDTNPCVTLKQLAVRGSDLAGAGVPGGKAVGECLRYLLDRVMEDTLPNDRGALLRSAGEWVRQGMPKGSHEGGFQYD
ncbi:MAG: CCA tRNA nucleotidyltransferase [Aristaeellaceae bacterium]